MKRQFLAAALAGLVVGGCAQSRSAKLPDGSEGDPVGIVPIPSIHDTINRGGNPGVAKATLPDPSNPNWSGHPLISKRPATGLAPKIASSDGRSGAAAPTAAPAPATTRWSEPPRQLAAAPAAAAAPEAMPALPDPADDAAPLPPAAESDAAPASAEVITPVEATEPAAAPASEPPAAVAPAPAPVPAGEDPLLGPAPELMPAIDPAAAGVKAPEKPQAAPAPEPAPAVEPPPIEPAPAPGPSAAARPIPVRGDGAVQKVSATSAALAADVDDSQWKEAGRSAARVGDEVITLRELVYAVKETVRKQGGKASQLSREEQNMVAKHVLAGLIERSLLIQEAKHQLKGSDKQLAKVIEAADKFWHDEELPPLLRQNSVETEYQLRRKFEEEGRSLTAIQQNFRQEFLAHAFMQQKLGGKIEVGLPEMLEYYNQHIDDKENYRSAAIVWREILVDKRRHPTPAEARKKIDDLLVRLRKGEDFARLAAAESEGPTRTKAAGGLMETAPGSYIVAEVNKAIEALPLNTTSDVVEGPDSYHLLRVESRRAGGPASFAELQGPIRQALQVEKSEQERKALLAALRKKTIIKTIFDGTESDPNQVRR
ncbi:peptidylprolyl isomerase [Paludisphaera mucosa]|uniref:peptidylprolyl isomerase n=1 Tax=Paludisphaera mucosa TaxID=3030827 RepID=A0ABT6FG29_9BACT|nr:peptidylprolyl isomerase [Paludisphaera mucosa]MDG3006530.1 peptidylprolyl isomerase [Paludisphaera mucosa]